MLTKTAPAFYRSSQLPPGQTQAMAQSMMNCGQPLQHRGQVSFGRPAPGQSNGVLNSVGWDPSQYPGLFPQGGNALFIDLPGNGGYQAGDWASTFYGGPYFDLSTQLQQNLNQFHSGPTVTVQGDTVFDNTTTENLYAVNVTTETLNGEPAPGQPGAQGPAGPQGDRGLDGAPGFGFIQAIFNDNRQFINNPILPLWIRVLNLELNLLLLDKTTRDIDRRLRNLKIAGWPQGRNVLTGAYFNTSTCEVEPQSQAVALRITGNE